MKVLTRKQRAKDAPHRWAKIYGDSRWADKQDITFALSRLAPEDRTPERINEIIGNDSWTRVECDECGEEVEAAVEIGCSIDFESHTALACQKCLRKAFKLVRDLREEK